MGDNRETWMRAVQLAEENQAVADELYPELDPISRRARLAARYARGEEQPIEDIGRPGVPQGAAVSGAIGFDQPLEGATQWLAPHQRQETQPPSDPISRAQQRVALAPAQTAGELNRLADSMAPPNQPAGPQQTNRYDEPGVTPEQERSAYERTRNSSLAANVFGSLMHGVAGFTGAAPQGQTIQGLQEMARAPSRELRQMMEADANRRQLQAQRLELQKRDPSSEMNRQLQSSLAPMLDKYGVSHLSPYLTVEDIRPGGLLPALQRASQEAHAQMVNNELAVGRELRGYQQQRDMSEMEQGQALERIEAQGEIGRDIAMLRRRGGGGRPRSGVGANVTGATEQHRQSWEGLTSNQRENIVDRYGKSMEGLAGGLRALRQAEAALENLNEESGWLPGPIQSAVRGAGPGATYLGEAVGALGEGSQQTRSAQQAAMSAFGHLEAGKAFASHEMEAMRGRLGSESFQNREQALELLRDTIRQVEQRQRVTEARANPFAREYYRQSFEAAGVEPPISSLAPQPQPMEGRPRTHSDRVRVTDPSGRSWELNTNNPDHATVIQAARARGFTVEDL